MTEITVAHKPGVGWWYRVHVSPTQDWSGIAPTMDEAWCRARVLAVRVDDTGITNASQE